MTATRSIVRRYARQTFPRVRDRPISLATASRARKPDFAEPLRSSARCSYTVITMATKTRIVRIGNSRGIRIPKTLLDEADLPEEVELHAQPGRLVVQAARHPRTGWAAAAKRMRARGDDKLLDEPTSTKFDREEWEWR
jgi:antitoxin MazE